MTDFAPPPSTLTTEKALGVLFDGMLDTWQNLDHFLAPSDPCAFIVYAHQNDDYGNSHADCVVLLIQWLKKIHARIISDKWPSLTYVDRDGGDAPTCNIVANQICLLPSSDLQDEHQPVRSVTKVVLCSSETLRIYYGHEFTAPYIRRIKEAYSEAKKQGLGFEHLQQNINLVVEDCHQKPGFHHVLTELAFLEIRNSSTSTGNTGESDIIKVCLDNKSPDYMPFAGSPTDVELLLESSNGLTALHRLFFKLLRRLSPKNGEQIGIIQHEYQTAASRILGGTVSTEGNVRQLASDTFDKAVVTIRNLLQAHTRSLGRLRTELLSPENTRNTALAQGAESGNVAIIPQLPTEYTVMMRKDRETAFVDATRNGHLDAVQSLLEQGARLDSTDDQGRAGLSRAARGGHCEVVRVLLEKGASIDLTDNDGRAALSQAAGYGHCAVVGVLLEKGASTDWMDNDGRTALSRASGYGHCGVVRALLEKGASIDLTDNDGRTALSRASGDGHCAVVGALLEKDANIDWMDNDGRTALSRASGNGHSDVVKTLLEKSINSIDLADNGGRTALLRAAGNGHSNIVRILREKGASTC